MTDRFLPPCFFWSQFCWNLLCFLWQYGCKKVKYPQTPLKGSLELSADAHAPRTRLTRRCSVGYPKKMGIRNQIRSESYTASLAFLPLSPQGGTPAAARLPQAV